jgi:predicted GIY-YIG superfamily endonuclease
VVIDLTTPERLVIDLSNVEDRVFYVYVMEHVGNGRRWYGYTEDHDRRRAQHAARLVKTVRDDIPPGAKFQEVYTFEILYEYGTQSAAEYCEARLIQKYRTTQIAYGYNVLKSKPGWSAKYYYLKRRGLLA